MQHRYRRRLNKTAIFQLRSRLLAYIEYHKNFDNFQWLPRLLKNLEAIAGRVFYDPKLSFVVIISVLPQHVAFLVLFLDFKLTVGPKYFIRVWGLVSLSQLYSNAVHRK